MKQHKIVILGTFIAFIAALLVIGPGVLGKVKTVQEGISQAHTLKTALAFQDLVNAPDIATTNQFGSPITAKVIKIFDLPIGAETLSVQILAVDGFAGSIASGQTFLRARSHSGGFCNRADDDGRVGIDITTGGGLSVAGNWAGPKLSFQTCSGPWLIELVMESTVANSLTSGAMDVLASYILH